MLLIKYPDILDSIAFRKFLLLNPHKFNEFKVENGSFFMEYSMVSSNLANDHTIYTSPALKN